MNNISYLLSLKNKPSFEKSVCDVNMISAVQSDYQSVVAEREKRSNKREEARVKIEKARHDIQEKQVKIERKEILEMNKQYAEKFPSQKQKMAELNAKQPKNLKAQEKKI